MKKKVEYVDVLKNLNQLDEGWEAIYLSYLSEIRYSAYYSPRHLTRWDPADPSTVAERKERDMSMLRGFVEYQDRLVFFGFGPREQIDEWAPVEGYVEDTSRSEDYWFGFVVSTFEEYVVAQLRQLRFRPWPERDCILPVASDSWKAAFLIKGRRLIASVIVSGDQYIELLSTERYCLETERLEIETYSESPALHYPRRGVGWEFHPAQ